MPLSQPWCGFACRACIYGWCNATINMTWWNTQTISHTGPVRESLWCKDQYSEIERHCSGNVGHNSEHNGDTVLWKYENPRHPLYEHDQSIGTEELVCGDRWVTGTSMRSLLQRAKSQQTNPLCPHSHVSPRVVHRTDISDATDLWTTNQHRNNMVPMEREHFQGTTVHYPTAEATVWVELDKCRCGKSSIITLPLTNTKYSPMNFNGGLVSEVESSDTGTQPAPDPTDTS